MWLIAEAASVVVRRTRKIKDLPQMKARKPLLLVYTEVKNLLPFLLFELQNPAKFPAIRTPRTY